MADARRMYAAMVAGLGTFLVENAEAVAEYCVGAEKALGQVNGPAAGTLPAAAPMYPAPTGKVCLSVSFRAMLGPMDWHGCVASRVERFIDEGIEDVVVALLDGTAVVLRRDVDGGPWRPAPRTRQADPLTGAALRIMDGYRVDVATLANDPPSAKRG